MEKALTFLCITTAFKGNDFIRSCKEAGNRVFLMTTHELENSLWRRDCIDEFFFIHAQDRGYFDPREMVAVLALVMKRERVDRIVALDDFDVEMAAYLREHFRIPGMEQTTARYFRDKLAMRTKAMEAGIRVPAFSGLFNDEEISRFIRDTPGPWMLKPRTDASSQGISRSHTPEALWEAIHALGDNRHEFLVEQFKPGDVYRVDCLSMNGRVIFNWSSVYLSPPFEVALHGGIFRSVTVPFGSAEAHALETLSVDVLKAFGLLYSASHTEVIRSHEDGQYYFLETSCRVGGVHLAEMVEASSGINLWREWALLETAVAKGESYKLPPDRKDYAGIILSRSPHQWPDLSLFSAPEVVWTLNQEYHTGCIVQSRERERVLTLLDHYAAAIGEGHQASPLVTDDRPD